MHPDLSIMRFSTAIAGLATMTAIVYRDAIERQSTGPAGVLSQHADLHRSIQTIPCSTATAKKGVALCTMAKEVCRAVA